jgi:hypothetical protein
MWHDELCTVCQQLLKDDELPKQVGSAHMPAFAHYECDADVLMGEVRRLQRKLYMAEAVCWAKFRIEQVGAKSVDPEKDKEVYARQWSEWKKSIRAL